MDPSDVRRTVLREHRRIRERLDDLLELAHGGAGTDALQRACQALLPVLLDHIDLEDRILVPALMDADAFGDVRTSMLAAHHDAQRAQLRAAIAALGAADQTRDQVLAAVRTLVYDLQVDMAQEDRDLLDPAILSDSLVTVAPGG